MFAKKIFIILFLFFNIAFAQQYTIQYKILVHHLNDQTETITTGVTTEDKYIHFPPYDLSGDIDGYQDLYNVVKGSTFRIESGALSENVYFYFHIMSFDRDYEDYYFDHNLFFYMGVQVDGERTGWHDFDDTYSLNTGKYAYLRIPRDSELARVLNYLRIDEDEIDFAYHTRDGYNQDGIRYTQLQDSLQCRLSHFSKFGGGRGSVLPVELQNFHATVNNGKVILNWETATETNNYGFEILKQNVNDEQHEWHSVGFVNGAGNSNSPRSYTFTDNNVEVGKFYYMLRQIDINGQINHLNKIMVEITKPKKFELLQNYPNPFNPTTKIKYQLAEASNVKLTIYNSLGEKIKTLVNQKQEAGIYSVNFNAENLPSGMYIYELQTEKFHSVKKMLLMK